MRPPATLISSAEATLAAVRSVWARVLLFYAAVWLGLVVGQWLSTPDWLNVWAGNPLHWFVYQCRACARVWGLVFLVLCAGVFYVWMFADSPRFVSLTAAFLLHAVQVVLLERPTYWIKNWYWGGLGVWVVGVAVLIGWRVWRARGAPRGS